MCEQIHADRRRDFLTKLGPFYQQHLMLLAPSVGEDFKIRQINLKHRQYLAARFKLEVASELSVYQAQVLSEAWEPSAHGEVLLPTLLRCSFEAELPSVMLVDNSKSEALQNCE